MCHQATKKSVLHRNEVIYLKEQKTPAFLHELSKEERAVIVNYRLSNDEGKAKIIKAASEKDEEREHEKQDSK